MSKKMLVGVLLVLSLLLSACYPELSVQQYDKLRAELEAMDIERQELRTELTAMQVEMAEMQVEMADDKSRVAETRAFVEFLDRLLAEQRGAMILYGNFDIAAVIAAVSDHKDELMSAAEELGDSKIVYYLGLVDPDNGDQAIAAYYKIIECCLQKVGGNLEE
ncbi:hypothetical protein ACFLWL_04075 [Chloroflexota bacterium]